MQGRRPAHYAAMTADAGILRLLLERGIRLNVPCAMNLYPVHLAAYTHKLANIRLLVEEAGINPDLRTKPEGISPLICAAKGARLDYSIPEAVAVVQYLLGTGRVDVNARESAGTVALHHAAERGALDVIKVLVAAGADLFAKRKDGRTAAQLAKVLGYTETARYLVEQVVLQKGRVGPSRGAPAPKPSRASASSPGADPGLTNLLAAAIDGDLELVQCLVKELALDPKEWENKDSPLGIAAANGYLPMVRYLIEEKGVNPRLVSKKVS